MGEFHPMNRQIGLTAMCALLIAALGFAVQRNRATTKSSPFNEQRVAVDLQTIVGFGPRPAGSDAIAKTRSYIIAELQKAGLKAELDEFDARTPRGYKHMVNIRATRPGSKSSIIAITGHYDTKLFENVRFVGASDGGSSAAWLLEFARCTRDLKLENTLEFIFFDGEEAVVEWTDDDSVYGSRHDVDRRVRDSSIRALKAMILVDMIGDKNLNIKREEQSTRWLKDIIWDTAHSVGYDKEFPNDEIEISDDHVPYLKAGVSAVDLIDFDYPAWHTAEDTLDKVSPRSLKIVGDVMYFSLPAIDRR
jgi:Zn-dependent M28 family amino/carboxypeptidase